MESLTTIANRHDFSTTFTNEYDSDVTASSIISPTSGKRIKVTGIKVSTEGATAAGQYVRIYFATTGDTIAKVFCTNAVTNVTIDDIVVEGAIDEAVSLTSTLGAGKNFFVAVTYKEEA